MKRNDHIFIWVIVGILAGFILFLAGADYEQQKKINEYCPDRIIATIHSNINKKDYVICDGVEPIIKEIK